MDVKNARDLAKIIALCRKNNVKSCKISADSIEFSLSDVQPVKARRNQKLIEEPAQTETLPTYSQEDILFWSAAMNNAVGGN
jgi:hypothetical protein